MCSGPVLTEGGVCSGRVSEHSNIKSIYFRQCYVVVSLPAELLCTAGSILDRKNIAPFLKTAQGEGTK